MAAAAADLLLPLLCAAQCGGKPFSLGKRALAREWCCSHRKRWMGTVDGGFPSV